MYHATVTPVTTVTTVTTGSYVTSINVTYKILLPFSSTLELLGSAKKYIMTCDT